MSSFASLEGRYALVTGAGQGVGRAIAQLLAEQGAAGIVVNDFFLDRAAAVADELDSSRCPAIPIQADVADWTSVSEMMASAEKAFGRIDVLVNNAGNAGPTASIVESTPFWETEPADWERWMSANYFGFLYATRAVLPGMVRHSYGRIVTVVSDAGRVGEPNFVVYSGAKAGAAGLMRGVAKAVGRYGITANSVALAAIETPATAEMTANEDVRKAMLRNYVVRRLGTPDDPAAMVVFLCSDAGEWITGQTIPVNGGYSFAL